MTAGRYGCTVEAFCSHIHREIVNAFKVSAWGLSTKLCSALPNTHSPSPCGAWQFALVWGTSVKHSPQHCGLAHVLHDEDVVQIMTKTVAEQVRHTRAVAWWRSRCERDMACASACTRRKRTRRTGGACKSIGTRPRSGARRRPRGRESEGVLQALRDTAELRPQARTTSSITQAQETLCAPDTAGHRLEQLLNVGVEPGEGAAPQPVRGVQDEVDERHQQAPRVRAVHDNAL